MTQVVPHTVRVGEKAASVSFAPFCDRDTLDAAILVSKDDAFFIDSLMNDRDVAPPTPAMAFFAFVLHLGGRFSEVGISSKLGHLRIVLMGGQAVGLVVAPGFALQVALLGELPIFYGEDEVPTEEQPVEVPPEVVQVTDQRAQMIAALLKRGMKVRVD